MIFTSYTYAVFLTAAFVIHWAIPERFRKPFLIFASYVFYATWKWQFGFLLLALSLFNWMYGRWILPRASTMIPLAVGILSNLSALVYFKYSNFLIANAAAVAQLFGSGWRPSPADIVLPLGISFFTFQGIAYLFDVAAGEEPLESLTDFLLFKALWPQLIAGPIVRLAEMRGQIQSRRSIDYVDFAEGSRRILQGAFKKMVLADNIAPFVEMVFLASAKPNAVDVVAGTVGFGLQIYFDFSAYSDIAIGSARLFGFRFPENFNWPYTAVSPQEFWNRWHMTLSRWIRDYLFTPLTFVGRRRPRLAPLWLLVTMALCGLWHGAQWTFVVWGIWHGILLTANQTFAKKFFADPSTRASPPNHARRVVRSGVTLFLVYVGWVLFRAHSLRQAFDDFAAVIHWRGGMRPAVLNENGILLIAMIGVGLLVVQTIRTRWEMLQVSPTLVGRTLRWSLPVGYAAMLASIIIFDQEARAFVYFQF